MLEKAVKIVLVLIAGLCFYTSKVAGWGVVVFGIAWIVSVLGMYTFQVNVGMIALYCIGIELVSVIGMIVALVLKD